MVSIKLRNGRILEAEVLPGGLYEAVLASGKKKTYALSDLKSVEDLDLQPEEDNKEEKVSIYHYLHDTANGVMRMLCTNPNEGIVERYNISVAEKRPVSNVFGIVSPWGFTLLENILVKSGRDFTVAIMRNEDVAALEPDVFNDYVDRANFAYANDANTYFMRVDGVEGFGLDFLGITIEMAKKSAKRLMEVLRQVQMSKTFKGKEMNNITISYPLSDGDPVRIGNELLYDGHSFARRSFIISLCDDIPEAAGRMELIHGIKTGKIVELIVRIITPYGVIKGNLTVVPDKQINADIVTHECNLKKELYSEGYIHVTVWEHEPMHMAVWDRQSELNFSHALPEKAITGDLTRLIQGIREEVKNGKIPSWLLLGEDAHDDDGVPKLEQQSTTINKSALRWQEAGNDIRAAQNLIYMWLGGTVRRMDRSAKVNGFHKKMWIPMTNAVLASVVTWESATRLGGFKFKNQSKNVCFYDKRIGFVMPGRRFVETAPYHGGWDGDDQAKIILVKVFSSDPEILVKHLGKTVPATSPFFAKEEDARVMALIVRSPNGPGEWSLEEVDVQSLPIARELRHDDLTVIDIAKMPEPSLDSIAKSKLTGIKDTTVYSGLPMTREDAVAMITAQFSNPGIEAFCNAMMVHAAIKPGYPARMLDKMETVVDTVKQGFDEEAFEAIAAEPGNILEQLFGNQIDRAILATRVGSKIWDKFIPVDGRYSRMQAKYARAIEVIKEELMNQSLQMRGQQPIVHKVRAMSFGSEAFAWAKEFYKTYQFKLGEVDVRFNADRETNPFRKMSILYSKKLAMEAVVNEMVEYFEGLGEDDRHHSVLALWKYIVSPHNNNPVRYGHRAPYGLMDRIIFQPNATGKKSVMDILIEALEEIK